MIGSKELIASGRSVMKGRSGWQVLEQSHLPKRKPGHARAIAFEIGLNHGCHLHMDLAGMKFLVGGFSCVAKKRWSSLVLVGKGWRIRATGMPRCMTFTNY